MKPGDVVMLKSGGPKMTVEVITGDQLRCVWFEGATLYRDTLPVEALKPIVY